MMGGTGMFMMLLWIVVLGLLIYGVYRLFSRRTDKQEGDAMLVLEEKFARGEISEEELRRRKAVLTED
ncbi:SHOCT domain-containing protein [Planomicrobium okeanokoites]|uniref:SHOCT domain-containing protein n=1 Tax=Planomicrobium okeanokoites TaxID=244 RepID=UPI003563ACD7